MARIRPNIPSEIGYPEKINRRQVSTSIIQQLYISIDIYYMYCHLHARLDKAPAVTVSSVLPVLKRADAEFVAEVNRQMRTTCDELNVKFVDNDANFAFKDGTVDTDVYHKDGLHLSGRGVSKLVSNLGLVEKRGKQTTKNPTTSVQQQKATITVNR